jgi:hypothetical protein
MTEGIEALQELRDKIAGLPGHMPKIIKTAFEGLAPMVEDLNLANLAQGLRADGTQLPDYSYASVHVFGKRPGPMTMHNHGDFWKGIKMTVNDDSIDIEGTDMKTDMLQLTYGQDIIGISEDDEDKISNEYLPAPITEELNNYFDIASGGS